MTTLEFILAVDAPLESLWQFHGDVTKALPLLSPPKSDVRIVVADLPARLGQRVEMNVRGPLGVRLKWVARVVEFQPPQAREGGSRFARFVDEQESGPFAYWRHEHVMDEISEGRSRLIDRVTYRVPLGPLGKVANRLFVDRQLNEMFAHRHRVTAEALNT